MINYDLPWNPMRIVQRHGRVDRIGSKHDYVRLGLFFPAERLDELLELEARLEAKLALADAAVGAGNVLPGSGPGHEINLTDDNVEEEFAKLLDAGGSSASLSGEEYRRRVFDAFNNDTLLKDDVLTLPYGAGSGFESSLVHGNAYVFCARIGSSSKPWFRCVPVSTDWSVRVDESGVPQVSSDTLMSLRAADPGKSATARWLSDEAYDKAFDAWAVARDDIYERWTEMTDPSRFDPDLPLSFRDASMLVVRAGGYLPHEQRVDLGRRLRAVPSAKVARQMRAALNNGRTDEERIALVAEVLDEAGIVPPPPRDPLPYVEEHEVRLVAWMAVRGTRDEYDEVRADMAESAGMLAAGAEEELW